MNAITSVYEYLSGSGQRGGMSGLLILWFHLTSVSGPLVTTGNVTTRSDLRMFTSDNNVTMTR